MKIEHPIDKQIRERIRKQRLVCGFSQRELGERMGISFQLIQRYESGDIRVTIDRLDELAKALSVGISYFFTKISESKVMSDIALSDIGSEEISRLVREYRKIKDETLCNIVHSVIRALHNK